MLGRGRGAASAAFALAIALTASGCASVARTPLPASPQQSEPLAITPPTPVVAAQSEARVESRTFKSEALGRTMPYTAWLPPGYDESTKRYPTLYLLHGMGGNDRQWLDVGVASAAARMIRAGEMAPLVIVMPEGRNGYWIDHANGGEKWGTYTAVDLVREVGDAFRVKSGPANRAIGGLSMGAHGAIQLALNYPETFSVVGAHSLVLRRYGSAPAYFGSTSEFASRDPMQLVKTKSSLCRSLALWIDIGSADPWSPLARQFNDELTEMGIAHEWHEWPGDHSGLYWQAHVRDYLRYYDRALARRAGGESSRAVTTDQ